MTTRKQNNSKASVETLTVICEWFARCDNPADGVVNHPVLGDVPTCQRCADKLDLDLIHGSWS